MNLRRAITLTVMLALAMSACLQSQEPAEAPTSTPSEAGLVLPATATTAPTAPAATTAPPATIPPTDVPPPTVTAAPSDTPEPTAEPSATPDVLPREAVRIEFAAGDGTALVGYYYPAAVENAPLVVLMHMAGDNQLRWVSVGLAPWLQNRGLPGTADGFAEIYPPMPAGRSYAVFTFDFRRHGESGEGPLTDGHEWLDDARAAVDVARQQAGVDPSRVGLAGSSIGADAAVDVCADGCVAALSFSPGSYLGMVYSTTVQALDERSIPAWCLAAAGDREADPTCASASGEHYQSVSFEGNDHGTNLIRAGQTPEIGPIVLAWLDLWAQP